MQRGVEALEQVCVGSTEELVSMHMTYGLGPRLMSLDLYTTVRTMLNVWTNL